MKESFFFQRILSERWFIWTLVFLFVAGVSLIAYIQWVNLEFDTTSTLSVSQIKM